MTYTPAKKQLSARKSTKVLSPLGTLGRRARRSGPSALADAVVGTSGFLLADLLRFGTGLRPDSVVRAALLLIPLFAVINYRFGLHRRVWRQANLCDVGAMVMAVGLTAAAFSALDAIVAPLNQPYWFSTIPSGAVFAFLLLLLSKTMPYMRDSWARAVAPPHNRAGEDRVRLLVVGTGEMAAMLVRDLRGGPTLHAEAEVVGFIDDNPARTGMRLHGLPILGTRHDIARLVDAWGVDAIAIALPRGTQASFDELVLLCQQTGARVQILSSLGELATTPAQLHEITIADLLGRDETQLDLAACAPALSARVVLVTGAAGSIGSELCHQLLHLRPRRLIVLDTNETGLFDLEASLHAVGVAVEVVVRIADITDAPRVARIFAEHRPDVVFHAAAYKHVPLLESHAYEVVKANVHGAAVLCRLAHACGVGRFVFVSSDKAVAPASNLGYSKRLGELLMRAYAQESPTVFCAVRFGNVLGSRGSVIPTFERQIAAGEALTVTHPEATRYFMSIPEAASLVIEAGATAASGTILMLDMGEPVSIKGLAERMLRLRGRRLGQDAHIVYTGLRPGEKLHEALTTELEVTRPTGHAKILEVLDPHIVRRASLEETVQALVALARDADNTTTGYALRCAALGLALPPAAREAATTLERTRATLELAMTSASTARMAAHLAEQVTVSIAADVALAGPCADEAIDEHARDDERRVIDFPRSWLKRRSMQPPYQKTYPMDTAGKAAGDKEDGYTA